MGSPAPPTGWWWLLVFVGTWASVASCEEWIRESKTFHRESPDPRSINKSPSSPLCLCLCHPEHEQREAVSPGSPADLHCHRGTEGKVVCKTENTHHAFTLYCNLSIFCMYLLLWVCISFPPVLTLSFFCGLLLFLLSNLQPNWEISQWLTYLNIIA